VPVIPPTRPRYKNVPRALANLLWDMARGAPAPLTAIEERLFAEMTPAPVVSGKAWIPPDSPFVAIFNHYESEHVAAWWGPFLMTGVIAENTVRSPKSELYRAHREEGGYPTPSGEGRIPVQWLMAREWWYPGGFGRLVKQPLTRLLFARLAQVYGFVRVPPVLDGDLTRGEGVAGVRQALALTRGENPPVVGLAPEGHGGKGGTLKEPPSGAGLFLLHLTHERIPLLPIGWYEDEAGRLTIRFGSPFQLLLTRMSGRHSRDRAAATQAMTAIGRLLPDRLWGTYRGEIEETRR
jgi:hypothetical protein